MSDEFKLIIESMQEAVDEEFVRKAKLGFSVVVSDSKGNPVVVPAVELVHKRNLKATTSF